MLDIKEVGEKAFLDLVLWYYVFEVTYPCPMIGIFSFLQDIALVYTDNV